MVLNGEIRAYYENNPLMVSSPFGGVDGINEPLLEQVLDRLGIQLEGKRILDAGVGLRAISSGNAAGRTAGWISFKAAAGFRS
jgi:hypothetical protein